jgi:hypothetical protein
MDDLGITNDHLKEHLMTLSMDKKVLEAFEKLSPQTKSMFTRAFNSSHKDDTKGIKGKGKAAKTTEDAEGDNPDDEEDEAAGGELITEEEILERRKAKEVEKQSAKQLEK